MTDEATGAGDAGALRQAQGALSSSKGGRMQIAEGPFEPDWESLGQYECPEWFRDAKFGTWAHWTAQCVPEQGDWYARNMYRPEHAHYAYHVEHYGHPSEFGFKDVCSLWRAEKWEPERLIDLYRRAGAKYFVALANHHCNFDCWDSKHRAWNSVNIGPRKDIVGTWARIARERGMRFGVTVHNARSWKWLAVAHGSDGEGPKKGVPYDGRLTRADGKGMWWEGYDPQELYCKPHPPEAPPDRDYMVKWFLCTKDLLDSYRPDLLYFDDSQLPLGEAGMKIAAHFYNASMQWHGGTVEAVLNTKRMPEELRGAVVWDIERGYSDRIEPFPWQTDTCIGHWHYHKGITYKTAAQTVRMLADIVSKNGNMLLNIPQRGDGSIDEAELAFLEDMAAWMEVGGEAIFGTRPWVVHGEGPAKSVAGAMREAQEEYTARDIRFTVKGGALYAIALGWPEDGKLVVRSLAKSSGEGGKVTAVALLGHAGDVPWTHDESGLTVTVPGRRPCEHAFALRIEGEGLRGFKP